MEELRDALIFCDDQMLDVDVKLAHAFTRGSHHRQNSVLLIVQNFFNKNKHMRTISLNAQYLVFFKLPRDVSQFTHLARQMFPDSLRHALESYKNATQQPYSYLLLDLRCNQDVELRLRSNIFPSDRQVVPVYVPK